MADKSDAPLRHSLTIDASPQQIAGDVTGAGIPIPLSPQWLMPKTADNKTGLIAGDSHLSSHQGHRSAKASDNSEEFHIDEKRRDALWVSPHDAEIGRQDRWRDEERDTNSLRRNHWREGERDKEITDTRRERRTDGSFRHPGDSRRAPSDRWSESGSRENNFEQRRESKWNTRWGPDDKESDGWREKKMDHGREDIGSRDKVFLQSSTEREGEHFSRPWRPNTSQVRWRGDSSFTVGKQGQMFGYGRGRVENGSSVYSAVRGKTVLSPKTSRAAHFSSSGFLVDKPSCTHEDSSPLRYSRSKLLDIYRMMDANSSNKLLGVMEVPSLMQMEMLEPLALTTPTSEEVVTLKGIEKGDITSSGMPQVTKDGFVGHPLESVISKHERLGNKEDLPSSMDNSNNDVLERKKNFLLGYHDDTSHERHMHQSGDDLKVKSSPNLYDLDRTSSFEVLRSEGSNLKKSSEVAVKEAAFEQSSSSYAVPWRSQSLVPGDLKRSLDVRTRTSDIGWTCFPKDEEAKQMITPMIPASCLSGDGFHSETNRDLRFKPQLSDASDRERLTHMMQGPKEPFTSGDNMTSRKFQLQLPPEELMYHYKDPQGQIQGPFCGNDLIGWFEAGYFGLDLQIRLADSPPDSTFSLLGDVMPHLRMKAGPPPGFGVQKQFEAVGASAPGNWVGNLGVHGGFDELKNTNSGQKRRHESATEAENRFLESLMSRNVGTSVSSLSFSEGVKGYNSTGPAAVPSLGQETGNDPNYLLAQRMLLERQQSAQNHFPFLVGKDTTFANSKSEQVLDTPARYSTLVPSVADTHANAHFPQHADLLSILQATADNASSPAINNNLPPWLNSPDVQHLINNMMLGSTGAGPTGAQKNSKDAHLNQHFNPQTGYGVQPQHLQQLNQSSLSHVPQSTDFPAGFVLPENTLSSMFSQDPRTLSMLQQRYLQSQLQLQSQMSGGQLSFLDKILLMKEQQKQEQQQQQLFLQQHVLSQILSECQPRQHTGDSNYGMLQAVGASGDVQSDHLGPKLSSEVFHNINTQMQSLNIHDDRAPTFSSFPKQGSQERDVSFNISSNSFTVPMSHPSLHSTASSKEDSSIPECSQNILSFESAETLPTAESTTSGTAVEKASQEVTLQKDSAMQQAIGPNHQGTEVVENVASEEIKSSITLDLDCDASEQGPFSKRVESIEISSDRVLEPVTETPVVKDLKQLEDREEKKSLAKKSKRQRNLKSQPTLDKLKDSTKLVNCEQSKPDPDIELVLTSSAKSVSKSQEDSETSTKMVGESLMDSEVPPSSDQVSLLSTKVAFGDKLESSSSKTKAGECAVLPKMETPTQRAWKPAPCLKAKSLVEIQQEEKQRAQVETSTDISSSPVITSGFSSAAWSGIVANADFQSKRDKSSGTKVQSQFAQGDNGDNVNSKKTKSQLHDLLAEASIESNEDVAGISAAVDGSFATLRPVDMKDQTDSAIYDDGDFIDSKETKKSRRKAAKAKGALVKTPAAFSSVDPVPSPSVEKNKSARPAQQEKDSSSVLPAGLSLGDFVPWKGDDSNSSPVPAWSTDPLRVQKPTSLRNILKEQEKKALSTQKQSLIVDPPKIQQSKNALGSSWQIPGSSPSKAESPIMSNIFFSPPKSKIEDDLFWGPSDQPKQESKQLDFPSLATLSSRGTRGTLPKNSSALGFSQPKSSSRTYLQSSTSAGLSSLKATGDNMSSRSEAMGFRDWCERELFRLTGSRDTGFLEFCLKQSTSEAEILLKQNLGSLDPHHEFIDKLLNYKELLTSDVLEIAFQPLHGEGGDSDGVYTNINSLVGNTSSDALMVADGSEQKCGMSRKKGKKGKKMSPSVLGFNVVSNRIMMGEIQNAEE